MRRWLATAWLTLLFVSALVGVDAWAASNDPHVIVISIDGFRPKFYLPGDNSKPCETLTELRNGGSYARGAIAVYPSFTYPGHAAIATGVYPARNGITANSMFDPQTVEGRGFWYASDIQTPALWDIARKAGLTVGAVSWPTTAGSASIDFNVPEFWTTQQYGNEFELMRKNASPTGLLDVFGATTNAMSAIHANASAWDEFLASCAIRIIRQQRPNLLFVHLLESDKVQHRGGRDTPELPAAMRRIDGLIYDIIEATKKAGIYSNTTFIVLGDHGFANVSQAIQPNVLLAQLGFITVDNKRATDWKAMIQNTGGSAAVYLKDPKDTDTATGVRQFFETRAFDRDKRLYTIIEKQDLVKMGGPRDAAFYLEAEPGYMFSGSVTGDGLVKPASLKGNHGFLPTKPELYTGFIAFGRGVKKGVTLETIRLVDVAPTAAKLLGLDFEGTDGRVLTEILQ
jgi:predicted AlkP superfamily pyrophosphatase or phosphodiesterase